MRNKHLACQIAIARPLRRDSACPLRTRTLMRNVQHDFRVVIADLIRSYKASCACMGLMCIVKAYLLLLAVIGYRKLYKMLCLCLLLLYVDLFIFNLILCSNAIPFSTNQHVRCCEPGGQNAALQLNLRQLRMNCDELPSGVN